MTDTYIVVWADGSGSFAWLFASLVARLDRNNNDRRNYINRIHDLFAATSDTQVVVQLLLLSNTRYKYHACLDGILCTALPNFLPPRYRSQHLLASLLVPIFGKRVEDGAFARIGHPCGASADGENGFLRNQLF